MDLFSDPECKVLIKDSKGIILETMSPGGTAKSYRIFPTTRDHFIKGKQVAWEWNMGRTWNAAWYINPETNLPEKAWEGSAEFIGRHIEEV